MVALALLGTSGSVQSSARVSLSVVPPQPGSPNNRTDFVRTDDTPLAVVYDPVHKQVFSSALHLNCVDVISLATASVVKCVPVSGALGLSLSADSSQVLVGTQVGQLAWIDTTSLQVVRRQAVPVSSGSPAGSNYVGSAQAYEAANGKVLIFAYWGYGDLYGNFLSAPDPVVEWDPIAGTSTPRPESMGGGLVSVSADHSKILIGGNGPPVLYDSGTDTFNLVPGFQGGVYEPAMNPGGTQFALLGGTPLIHFFNAQMNVIGTLDLTVCCGFRASGAVYSSDGRFLYVVLPNVIPLLVTVDAKTFQVVGTAPAYFSETAYFSAPNIVGHPQAADSTGLVFELADHGVAIDDSTNFQNLTNAIIPGGFIVATPDNGPTNAQTITNLSTAAFTAVPDLFLGTSRAENVNIFNGIQLQATAPPSTSVGTVNIKAITPSGLTLVMPQAFTYGSVLAPYGILASDSKGNIPADLFGYGLFTAGTPSAVQIGSATASVQSQREFPAESPYPFPLHHLQITLPSGSPGLQDIVVTSPSGNATFARSFRYLNNVSDYSSADVFTYLLYDSHRNHLYLSAGDHVDVFSLATQSFLSPITVPSISGARQLQGLTLTPDGSKLLVANHSDLSVAILNPDNPTVGATATIFPLAGLPFSPGPFQIATTSTNKALVSTSSNVVNATGAGEIFQMDLNTLNVTPISLPPGIFAGVDGTYLQGSLDGTVVLAASSIGQLASTIIWHPTANTQQFHQFALQIWNDIAVSADGNVTALSSDPTNSVFPLPYLADSNLNLTAQVNFPEFAAFGNGPGIQLDQSGALLYEPTLFGVDLIDARTAQLRERIVLSEQLDYGSKLMAITPAGDYIFLATTAGLSVAHLDAVPLGVGSVQPSIGPVLSVLTVRGSGFESGTTATMNGASASLAFTDASTVKITVPGSLPKGPVQLLLKNPDGTSFSVDALYTVQ